MEIGGYAEGIKKVFALGRNGMEHEKEIKHIGDLCATQSDFMTLALCFNYVGTRFGF